MKRVYLLIILLSFCLSILAQNIEEVYNFKSLKNELDFSELVAYNYDFSHFLGEDIGKKMLLLTNSYTWVAEPTPANPITTKVIEKPGIYNKIKKVERYYKKAVHKKTIDVNVASQEFENILDIAIQVRYQQTDDLESHLQNLKNPADIALLFTNNIFIN
ncbi:MAG: hypothetical protein ACJA08_001048 [Cyclobacteriaceae bacterium]|jgi:hypothetical protein